MPFSGIRDAPKDGTGNWRCDALEEGEMSSEEGAWLEEPEREERKKETIGLGHSDSAMNELKVVETTKLKREGREM